MRSAEGGYGRRMLRFVEVGGRVVAAMVGRIAASFDEFLPVIGDDELDEAALADAC